MTIRIGFGSLKELKTEIEGSKGRNITLGWSDLTRKVALDQMTPVGSGYFDTNATIRVLEIPVQTDPSVLPGWMRIVWYDPDEGFRSDVVKVVTGEGDDIEHDLVQEILRCSGESSSPS